ncbi:MAG: Rrf2 family transcriptional regulator [Croceitalea sp.]|nr:Rrf2 family transcriptional regulator [Croceitalea sp.]MBT8237490.1 Rrf2 family transcriptional regulator [Croceitalea sp.]NNC33765.1 Rrf2 family transcriptional regulator [Croceitalea sp.]NNL07651.1 Rrf2 family transcriptional regulator [Croceitalea sp.]NNM18038.1 Rrf2 family transcriptional regulator [Croceitalea sp.]
MLSNSSKYAIKGVLYLAMKSSTEKKILAKELSVPINVPPSYIAKLLQELGKHGIVSSTKGPKGGFYLNEANRIIPLIKIVDVIDGGYRLKSCMLSLSDCNEDHPCPLHKMVGNTKSNFVKQLQETTVNDLVADIKAGNSFLPL